MSHREHFTLKCNIWSSKNVAAITNINTQNFIIGSVFAHFHFENCSLLRANCIAVNWSVFWDVKEFKAETWVDSTWFLIRRESNLGDSDWSFDSCNILFVVSSLKVTSALTICAKELFFVKASKDIKFCRVSLQKVRFSFDCNILLIVWDHHDRSILRPEISLINRLKDAFTLRCLSHHVEASTSLCVDLHSRVFVVHVVSIVLQLKWFRRVDSVLHQHHFV